MLDAIPDADETSKHDRGRPMPFAAALSTDSNTLKAMEAICGQVKSQVKESLDLAIVFFSPHHVDEIGLAVEKARQRLQAGCVVGCMGESIIGNGEEIESSPAMSLWGAKWNKPVQIDPFHLVLERTPDGFSLMGWPDGLINAEPHQKAVMLLGEPTSFPVDFFLKQINENNQGMRVFGGMASGSRGQGP